MTLPAEGTKSYRVYRLLADAPGQRFTAQQIRQALDMEIHRASAVACQLRTRNVIQGTKPGHNGTAEYWVPNEVAS